MAAGFRQCSRASLELPAFPTVTLRDMEVLSVMLPFCPFIHVIRRYSGLLGTAPGARGTAVNNKVPAFKELPF